MKVSVLTGTSSANILFKSSAIYSYRIKIFACFRRYACLIVRLTKWIDKSFESQHNPIKSVTMYPSNIVGCTQLSLTLDLTLI